MTGTVKHYDIVGLEVLAPRRQLDNQDWLRLLEARHQHIQGALPSMDLPQLGKTACLESAMYSFHKGELGFSVKTTAPDGLSLKTPGIFKLQPWNAIKRTPNSGYRPGPGGINRPDGTKLLWGLTDKGQWLVVTIHFTGHPGYKDRGMERAESVIIEAVELDQMLTITQTPAERVWSELGQRIEIFAEQQLQIYTYARKMAEVVAFESTLYHHHCSTS